MVRRVATCAQWMHRRKRGYVVVKYLEAMARTPVLECRRQCIFRKRKRCRAGRV